MRSLFAAALALTAAAPAFAEDKAGPVVEVAGLKAAVPAAWKPLATPGMMRQAQLTVPKAEGDTDDADVSVFIFKGAGSAEQNLERQRKRFDPAPGKDKVEETLGKLKVGEAEAIYQDVKGQFKKKPFPMAEKFTLMPGWRQLYVLFDTKDGQQAYVWLVGPEKTVEANKAGFEAWLKALK